MLASQGFIHRHLPQLVSVGEPRIYTQTFDTTRQYWRAKDLYTDICHNLSVLASQGFIHRQLHNSSVLASQGFVHRHLPQLVSVGEPRIYTQTFATTCQCWRAKDLYTDSYTTGRVYEEILCKNYVAVWDFIYLYIIFIYRKLLLCIRIM